MVNRPGHKGPDFLRHAKKTNSKHFMRLIIKSKITTKQSTNETDGTNRSNKNEKKSSTRLGYQLHIRDRSIKLTKFDLP